MSYRVAIKKNSTGEIRHYDIGFKDWEDDDLFWWNEGNFSCDCNRMASFMRANGEEPPEEWPCGHEAYSVLYAETSDGRKIPIDDVGQEAG